MVLFDDGIGVKAHKPQRQCPSAPEVGKQEVSSALRVITDVVVLQTAPQQFEDLSAPMHADGSARVPLESVVQAKLQQVYGQQSMPVPLVIVSDKAKIIRNRWMSCFGESVTILLDWYPLSLKLRQLMSMIARNKAEKSSTSKPCSVSYGMDARLLHWTICANK